MNRWRRGLTRMMAGFLLLTAGGLSTAGSVTTSRAAVTVAVATNTQTLRALACPSVTDCYAVGDAGTILATHDAGATLEQQTSGTQDQLGRIACPSTAACFVLTNPLGCGGPTQITLLHTTDGGNTWGRNAFPQNCLGPGLSCPSVTTCYVFASCVPPRVCSPGSFKPGNPELYRTTDSGTQWQARGRTPDNPSSGNATMGIGVQSLACPSTTVCYAGGLDQLAGSTDGGSNWTRQFIYVPPCPTAEIYCHQLNLMSCPGARTCYAGGTSIWGVDNPFAKAKVTAVVVATTDGFRTSRRSVIGRFHGLVDLSCPTSTDCFALGGGKGPFSHDLGSVNETGRFATTTNGGATWRVERIARYPFTSLACPSVSVCYVAGYLGRLMKSTDSGTTWRDLAPALFLSGSFGATQPLHTYSPWFTATAAWTAAVDVVWVGPRTGCTFDGRTEPDVTVYVRNGQGKTVAGRLKIKVGPQFGDYRGSSTTQATGRLRLDIVSQCSSFTARIDGVGTAGG